MQHSINTYHNVAASNSQAGNNLFLVINNIANMEQIIDSMDSDSEDYYLTHNP